jgi:hypothetical protein
VHIPQAIQVSGYITATPLDTLIASFALSTSKSSAFESFIFVGQTVTQIPHPLQFNDCTSFLSFAIVYHIALQDMNISL